MQTFFISGFPPPYCYSVYHKQPYYCDEPIKDYNEALKLPKKNKPIMIDFTGYNCVNCRKMEENVWPDEKGEKLMSNTSWFLCTWMTVKKKLPAHKQFTYTTADGVKKKEIITVGDKWATSIAGGKF